MKKILIIEDAGPSAELLASLCEGPWRTVKLAETIEQAWDVLESDKQDLVFLDLTLPGLNPLDTLKEVPAIKKLSRCVIVTGNQDPQLPSAAKDVGADAFLFKHDPDFADRVMHQLNAASYA